jgi:phage shock protein A
MELPVLFKHEVESGVIARAKQYVIKDYKFVVDELEDAKAFVEQGFQVLQEKYEEAKKEKAATSKEKKAAE